MRAGPGPTWARSDKCSLLGRWESFGGVCRADQNCIQAVKNPARPGKCCCTTRALPPTTCGQNHLRVPNHQVVGLQVTPLRALPAVTACVVVCARPAASAAGNQGAAHVCAALLAPPHPDPQWLGAMSAATCGSVSSRLQPMPWLPSRPSRRPAQHRRPATRALPPSLADGSLSTAAASSQPGTADSLLLSWQQGLMQHPQLYILETLLVLVAAYAAAVWPDRPRGWCLSRLVAVRASWLVLWWLQACGTTRCH